MTERRPSDELDEVHARYQAASGGWHLALALAAGRLGRRITPRMQRALAIGGGLAVLGVATRLALAI